MDELQAGVESSFAALPQPSVLAALHNPALEHHLEGMQLAALGDLHRHALTQELAHALHEGLTHVAAVAQHAWQPLSPDLQRSSACNAPCNPSPEPWSLPPHLGVHRNVTLDPKDLLARVIALQGRPVHVFHALRVHDQARAASVAPRYLSGRVNLFF